jgi:hypothetical protein
MAWALRDTFTGGSDTTLASHAPDVGAAWSIIGSQTATSKAAGYLTGDSTSASAFYRNTTTPLSADYAVEADVSHTVENDTNTVSLAIRLQADGTTYYVLQFSGVDPTGTLKLISNPANATLGSALIPGYVAGRAYRVRLEARGTLLSVYVDGALLFSATDSGISGAGNAGIRIRANGRADNFSLFDTAPAAFGEQGQVATAAGAISSAAAGASGSQRQGGQATGALLAVAGAGASQGQGGFVPMFRDDFPRSCIDVTKCTYDGTACNLVARLQYAGDSVGATSGADQRFWMFFAHQQLPVPCDTFRLDITRFHPRLAGATLTGIRFAYSTTGPTGPWVRTNVVTAVTGTSMTATTPAPVQGNVWMALDIPYGLTELQSYLATIYADPAKRAMVRKFDGIGTPNAASFESWLADLVVGTTGPLVREDGQPIGPYPYIAYSFADWAQAPDDGLGRISVLLSAGQHASEDVGDRQHEAVVDWGMGSSAEAVWLRKWCITRVVPLMNVAGRMGGASRAGFGPPGDTTAAMGTGTGALNSQMFRDPNRNWDGHTLGSQSKTCAITDFWNALFAVQAPEGFAVITDLHGTFHNKYVLFREQGTNSFEPYITRFNRWTTKLTGLFTGLITYDTTVQRATSGGRLYVRANSTYDCWYCQTVEIATLDADTEENKQAYALANFQSALACAKENILRIKRRAAACLPGRPVTFDVSVPGGVLPADLTPAAGDITPTATPSGGTFSTVRVNGTGGYEFDYTAPDSVQRAIAATVN